MKATGIGRYLLITSATLLIGSAVVSIHNRVLRYSAQIGMCSVVIAYLEQLHKKQKSLKKDNADLRHQKTMVTQKLQLAAEEMRLLVQYTDEEFRRYESHLASAQKRKQKAEQERDILQIELWKTEERTNQRDEFHSCPQLSLVKSNSAKPAAEIAMAASAITKSTTDSTSKKDISNYRIAMVGGHPKAYRQITAYLQHRYNLTHIVHIPSRKGRYISRSQVHKKLASCELVMLITQYIDHALSDLVLDFNNKPSTNSRLLYINTTGASSIIRELDTCIEKICLRTA